MVPEGGRRGEFRWSDPGSDVEAEVKNVAVLDQVFFALGPHLAGLLGGLFAAAGYEILVGDGLGPDEAVFEIRMNDAGRFGGLGPASHGPGAGFLGPHSEKRNEVEQAIAGADDSGQARLLEPEGGEVIGLLGGIDRKST